MSVLSYWKKKFQDGVEKGNERQKKKKEKKNENL